MVSGISRNSGIGHSKSGWTLEGLLQLVLNVRRTDVNDFSKHARQCKTVSQCSSYIQGQNKGIPGSSKVGVRGNNTPYVILVGLF